MSKTIPCNILVRPVARESIMVNCARTNSTIAFISMPNVIFIPVMIDTAATAGIVSPMLASADPKARLRLV